MNYEQFTILLFGAIIILQQAYFMWQVHKLINKLMSRDFFSYNQTFEKKNQTVQNGFSINIEDPEIDRVKELNKSLGLSI